MRRASITEAKNRLSALIDYVRSGESVLITDRGVPVARLDPVPEITDERIARLVREGKLVPPRRDPRAVFAELDRAPLPKGDGVLDALLEERRTGR